MHFPVASIPALGLGYLHRRQRCLRINDKNTMNNTAKVIKSSLNHNFGIGSVGLVILKGIKFSVIMIGGNQWKIKNSNLKFN